MYIHPCVHINHSVNPSIPPCPPQTHVHMNWCRYSCREQLCPHHESTAPLIPSFLSKVVWPLPMSSCYLSRAMVAVVSSSLWLQMASFLSWPRWSQDTSNPRWVYCVTLSGAISFFSEDQSTDEPVLSFCGVWTSTPVSVAVAFLVVTWAFVGSSSQWGWL